MTMIKSFLLLLIASGLGFISNTDTEVDRYAEYGTYLMDVSNETLKARYVELHDELDQITEIQVREQGERLVYVSIGTKDGIAALATISYPKINVENFFLPPPCSCNFNLNHFYKGNRVECVPCAQDD